MFTLTDEQARGLYEIYEKFNHILKKYKLTKREGEALKKLIKFCEQPDDIVVTKK